MDRSQQESLFKEIVGYISGDGDRTRLWERELSHPASAYISDEVHDAEKAMIRAKPIIVGHASTLSEAGDYLAHTDSGVPILVIRQNDGSVKAFVNACRHRGARVCAGERGSGKSFACPYHAWTYSRDGALRRVPRDGFPNIDTADFGLLELPCESRHGLIWVILTPGVEIDVATYLGPLDKELAQYPMDRFVLERDELIDEPLNWKFILDGFLEVYHIPMLHVDSIAEWFYGRYSPFDEFGQHSRLVGVRRSFKKLAGKTFSEAGDMMEHIAVNYQLFPNTIVVWQGDHFEVWTSYPGDTPKDCKIRIMSLVTPEMSGVEFQRRWDQNWKVLINTVSGEDWTTSREIQEGLPYVKDDRLLFGRNEPGLQHFHSTLTAELHEKA